MKVYTLNKTIPSKSHNARYSVELGTHWPEGEKFVLAPKYYDKYYGKKAMMQVEGEEVIVLFPEKTWNEYFK